MKHRGELAFHVQKEIDPVSFLGIFKFRSLFIPTVESSTWFLRKMYI